jgi:S-adenosylmethionine hydrolase
VILNVEEVHIGKAGVMLDDVLEIRFPGGDKAVHPPIRASFKRTYADVRPGEFLCLFNSENRFEVAANHGSAAAKLSLWGSGHPIEIRNVKRHGAP